MPLLSEPQLQHDLERHVISRTNRRVRDLQVEVLADRVVLHGRTTTYHVKQLAQHGVRDMLPTVELENAIEVGA